jgi:NADH dehydrogenase
MARPTRILVLGGGFAGIYTARRLEKRLAGDPGVEITLVNRDNFFLFTPMLHEIAASDLDITNIVSPVRKLLRKTSFIEADIESIDLARKRVTIAHGSEPHTHELECDHLVLALGSVTNFFSLPGLEEQAITMKTLGDAVLLRNRMIAFLEEADTECAVGERTGLLTFVVAGGGFAGVETVAGINDFLRDAVRFYRHIGEANLRVVLVHSGEVILPELGDELGRYAQQKLAARGVEIRTGARVAALTNEGVRLSTGEVIEARTLVWTAGTSPHPKLSTLPCQKDRGRIVVNEFLEVPYQANVWALGDCAVVPNPKTGKPHPPTAQHAIREARTAADNIVAAIRGGRKRRFEFATIGQLAAIGRRTGVAKVFGVKFSGFTAWWLWRTIYLSKLPRFEKKLRVALDWTLDVFFSKDLVQFLTPRGTVVSHEDHAHEDHPGAGASARPRGEPTRDVELAAAGR